MTARASKFTQADVARVIRAAKREGASEVVVRSADKTEIVVKLAPSTAPEAAPEEIVL